MLAMKTAVFLIALGLGIEAASFVRYNTTTLDDEFKAARPVTDHMGHWTFADGLPNGSSPRSRGTGGPNPAAQPLKKGNLTAPLKVLSKRTADYTEAARNNGTQGAVTLRVTFLASGGIGAITVVKSLPDGLTEQAIAAARQIRFEPEYVEGLPRTTSRPVTYNFSIY